MANDPTISVIILAYRNSHLIRESIDSVLEQSYGNIELIVSDDCSGDFDRREITDYIQSGNRGNISNLLVFQNEANLGTVRHLNKVVPLSRGRYVKFVAADDALHDPAVIADFIDFFQKSGAMVVASQVLICDQTMTRVLAPALREDQKEKLLSRSPQELYLELVRGFLTRGMSLGLGFDRTFFDRYRPFDEKYQIDEDMSMWLRVTRLGCPIHYMDRITAKYRFGGICSGALRCDERPQIRYREDMIRIANSEILPYREQLGEKLWREKAIVYLRHHEWPMTFSPPPPLRFF